MTFWSFIRELIVGDQPKQPARPAESRVSEADRCRDEINRLVAEFLAEGHPPVVELYGQRTEELGYASFVTTGGFALRGQGWVYNVYHYNGFALNTDGAWSYVGCYCVRDHHHVEKVELWEGTPTHWLEIDEREFRHYTDTGTASPQYALEAAQAALTTWRQ